MCLTEAARVPRLKSARDIVIINSPRDRNLRLPREARHVREARRPATRAHAHEALGFVALLHADVARLALGVLGALFDRDRDGLLVFFVRVVLFRVAAAVNFYADRLMTAAPVVALTGRVAISSFALATPLCNPWGVAQGLGAFCASDEDHFGST